MSNPEQPQEPKKSVELPEIRLKPGYKKIAASMNPSEKNPPPKQERSSALSIDDMLAITGKASQAPSQPATAPTPPPAAAPPPPPAPPTPAVPAPPPPSFNLPKETEPITVAPPPPIGDPEPFTLTAPQSFPPRGSKNPLLALSEESRNQDRLKKGGLAVLALGLVVALVVGIGSFFSGPTLVLIKSKPSGASVYLQEELLGKTPLEVELHDLEDRPVLKMEGYKPGSVPELKAESGKAKTYVVLEKVPFSLDWAGLPKGTRIWWEGTEKMPDSTVAGEQKIKVKPEGQSSFLWTLKIPWKQGETFSIGQKVAEEIKKRPVLKLSLEGTSKAKVIVKDGPRFTTTVSLGKTPSAITLPAPGKYLVKVNGTEQHASFKKEISLKEGARESLKVALWQARSAPAPVRGGGGGRSWSRPAVRRSYSPPPSYSGGGGGGGQIAPPSF